MLSDIDALSEVFTGFIYTDFIDQMVGKIPRGSDLHDDLAAGFAKLQESIWLACPAEAEKGYGL